MGSIIYSKIKFIIFVFLILTVNILSQNNYERVKITIDSKASYLKLNRKTFGSNINWINNGDGLVFNNKITDEDIRLIKNLGIDILRYPGGDLAEKFDWKNSIGELSKRGTSLDYGNKPAKIIFGLTDFLNLCERLNIQPLITVGFTNNTLDNIMQLVEYCDGDTSTFWGRQRAIDGHPRPYNVKYWEIGNGVYWKGMSLENATDYSNGVNVISKSIKNLYPYAKVGAILNGHNDVWDKTVISICAPEVDFLVVHEYYPNPNIIIKDTTQFNNIVIASTKAMEENLKRLERLAQAANNDIKFAVTEYNLYLLDNKGLFINGKPDILQGLFIAECLKDFITDPDIMMACKWQLSSYTQHFFADINFNKHTKTWLSPSYYIQKLIYNANIDSLIKISCSSPTTSVKDYWNKTPMITAPLVSSFGGINENHSEITFFINNMSTKSFDNSEVDLLNYSGNASINIAYYNGVDSLYNKSFTKKINASNSIFPINIPPLTFIICTVNRN